MNRKIPRIAFAIALVLGFSGNTLAASDRGRAMYVAPGGALEASDQTQSLTMGIQLPWNVRNALNEGAWSTHWNLQASEWHARVDRGHRRSFSQLGAIAEVRYRLGKGRSPLFVEAGMGGTVMGGIYHSRAHAFSTPFQFTEEIGIGYTSGRGNQHEFALFVEHFSNAGIKEPNPGENFLLGRYTYHF